MGGLLQGCKSADSEPHEIKLTSRRLKQLKPEKQCLLTSPPLVQGDQQSDSLWADSNLNGSLHKTATFASSLKKQPNLNEIPNSILQQFQQPGTFIQPVAVENHKEQKDSKEASKTHLKSSSRLKDQQSNKSIVRSNSSHHVKKNHQTLVEIEDLESKKESDTQTIKSILKKKPLSKSVYARGTSLKQNKVIDDTVSQKSLSKKVKFDPKLFRPKNRELII